MHSISIIIPVYNVEKYIERCLLSVMGQKNYEGFAECILVDDCTPDGSMSIAQRLIEDYQGSILFRIIHNPENQGLSCSRNNGLKIAQGDYVFFLDSDDYISTDCLDSLSKRLAYNDGRIDMVIGNSYYARNNKYWQDRDGCTVLLTEHADIMRRFLRFEIPMMAWNKLVRRQFLLDHHLLFSPRLLHEDELWSYKLYDVVNSVVLIPEVTYSYEQNEGSIMTSQSNYTRRIEAYHTLVNAMLASLDNHDLYVERFFWGVHMYMFSLDMIHHHKIPSELILRNKKLRKKMLGKSFGDDRLVIAFFLILTVFTPFNQLVRFCWFRNHYHQMTSFFKFVAIKCDKIHVSLSVRKKPNHLVVSGEV